MFMIDIQNGKLIGIYGDFQFREGFGGFRYQILHIYERHKNTILHTFAAAIAEKPKWMIFYIGIIT